MLNTFLFDYVFRTLPHSAGSRAKLLAVLIGRIIFLSSLNIFSVGEKMSVSI